MVDPTPIWGVIEFLVLVVICIIGVHIGFAMGAIGLLFAILFYGSTSALSLAGLTVWSYAVSWELTMLPLFIFMGEICHSCDIGKDAYEAFYRWLKNIRGSIAMASTMACAAFAAVTGSSAATVATIGGISVPQMKRIGYDRKLSLGSVAIAGTLGILIPPSIPMIIFAMLTETSVGRLFIGGIIPGIISAFLICFVIYLQVRLNPEKAPVGPEKYTIREKVAALKLPLPIFVIFVALMYSIYAGIASPTEAGALGAIFAAFVAIASRKLNWYRFKSATRETVLITAFIMLLIFGAMLFAHTIALTGFPAMLLDILSNIGVSKYLVIIFIIAASIILGCVLDVWGLMVLTVPIFYPIAIKVGFDPIWYGILTVILVELALITPPIAANIYIAQSLDPDARTSDVVLGVLPFYAVELAILALLVTFPAIALFLPSKMIG